MNIDPKIFKAYDIRGIYPGEINEETVISIIKGIIKLFQEKTGKEILNIVLGKDMRISSPSLFKIAKNTLLENGMNVIDIGLSATPTVYFTAINHKYDGGIQISASHNPKEYNGLKFFYRLDSELVKISRNTGMEDLKKICLEGDINLKPQYPGKVTQLDNALKNEVDYAVKLVNPSHIKNLKIVADAANAMGALFIEEIFKQFPGMKLVRMNFELDGTFPAHQADPLQFKLLKDLQEMVIKEHADFGIAPDGDGDRIFFINEKGEVVPATLITALVASEILRKKPGEKILFDVRYTKNAEKATIDNKGIPIMNIVGHALITEHLNKEKGAFAGESSGHFYYRETGGAESSIRTILYVMEVLSREKRPLSEILESLHSSFESSEYNFVLPDNVNPKEMLNQIAVKFPKGKLNWIDGLSIDFPDWRFNIRTSNTEPLLRLNVESVSKNLTDEKLGEMRNLILTFGAVPKD